MNKIEIKGQLSEDEIKELRKALVLDTYTIEERDGDTFLWINPEKREGVRQKSGESALEEIEEYAGAHGIRVTKRTYTRRENWKDPSRPRDSDVNRTDTRYVARVETETAQLVDEFLKTSSMTKKEFTTKALRLMLDHLDIKL